MGAGHRIEDQHGNDYRTWFQAGDAYMDDSTLRFRETWVEMSGIKERDVTDEVAHRAKR